MGAITERIDRIRELTTACARTAPPAPKSVKIELTSRCDFQCYFCAAHARPRIRSDMPRAFFERIVKEMRESGVEQLGVFYLGESFLCDWLPAAIRYAKEICGYRHVFLTTNGRLATPDRVRACMLAGLDSLKFSLNFSSARELHAVTGAAAGEYRTVLSNLKEASRIRNEVELGTGRRCGIYASSLRYDGTQERRMRKVLEEILPCVDEHYYLPLYGDARPSRHTRRGGAGVLHKALPCWSLFTEGHITSDGHLSACCFDHSERFDMGDLNRMSFIEAWHSAPFRSLRAAHLERDVAATVCAQCISYE